MILFPKCTGRRKCTKWPSAIKNGALKSKSCTSTRCILMWHFHSDFCARSLINLIGALKSRKSSWPVAAKQCSLLGHTSTCAWMIWSGYRRACIWVVKFRVSCYVTSPRNDHLGTISIPFTEKCVCTSATSSPNEFVELIQPSTKKNAYGWCKCATRWDSWMKLDSTCRFCGQVLKIPSAANHPNLSQSTMNNARSSMKWETSKKHISITFKPCREIEKLVALFDNHDSLDYAASLALRAAIYSELGRYDESVKFKE
jgi:hypothetical protein